MEQLLAISGVAEPLKLSYECRCCRRLTRSYCIVSHSRRIRSLLLSQDIPCSRPCPRSRLAQSPALYDVLVGPVQSPLFHQYLYGAHAPDCPLHGVGVSAADLASEAKRRRRAKPRESKESKESKEAKEAKEKEVKEAKEPKEPTRRRRKKEAEKESQPAGVGWAWVAPLTRRARGSLLTSFTDALPLITSSSDHSSLTADSLLPPKPAALETTTSVGPSFSNYLQLFNSNGWLETDHPDLADGPDAVGPISAGGAGGVNADASIAFPSFTRSNFLGEAPATPSFKPLPPSGNSFFQSPPKFDVLTNEKSSRLLNTPKFDVLTNEKSSRLLNTPKFDVLTNEKSSRDVNSRVSNLFNRMTTSDGNSIPLTFSLSPIVFNNKGNPIGESDHSFQKDTSLCFPISFDTKPCTVCFQHRQCFVHVCALRFCASALLL